jgi:hypothetical protein
MQGDTTNILQDRSRNEEEAGHMMEWNLYPEAETAANELT